MMIPNVLNTKIADENGNLTDEWMLLITQLVTELQLNLNNEGYKLPQLETVDINKLTDVDKSKGAMIYDSTTNQMKVNINGTWRVVQVI